MTAVKQEAMQLFDELTEDKMLYIVRVMKELKNNEEDKKAKKEILDKMKKHRKKIPNDVDYKWELARALEEKYGRID